MGFRTDTGFLLPESIVALGSTSRVREQGHLRAAVECPVAAPDLDVLLASCCRAASSSSAAGAAGG